MRIMSNKTPAFCSISSHSSVEEYQDGLIPNTMHREVIRCKPSKMYSFSSAAPSCQKNRGEAKGSEKIASSLGVLPARWSTRNPDGKRGYPACRAVRFALVLRRLFELEYLAMSVSNWGNNNILLCKNQANAGRLTLASIQNKRCMPL